MAASKAVQALFLFGFTLFVAGLLYRVLDEGFIQPLKTDYWINTPFLNLMDIGHNIIPTVILIMGIFCITLAGVMARKQKVVIE